MKKKETILLVTLMSVLTSSVTLGQVVWTKYEENPIFDVGPAGSWDDNYLLESSVIFDGTTYKMWYGASDGASERIGYATSPDGLTWTKHDSNPVLIEGELGSWDEQEVFTPYVLFDGTNYRMWFNGDNGQGSDNNHIGYATSPNGFTWTKHDSNPVLSPEDSWEGTHLNAPVVLMLDDTTFIMLYSGVTSAPPGNQIGLARSSDGVIWEKEITNPVLAGGEGWEGTQRYVEAAIFIDETLHMWWVGYGAAGFCHTGYATSPDSGVTWTRYEGNPVLSVSPGEFDAMCAGVGAVLLDTTTDTFKMWYDSWDGSNTGAFGYATAPDSIPPIGVKEEPVIADGFELKQNFPNPFNPETVIKYSIPKSENVSIIVYNLLGEDVAQLVDEKKTAGSYAVNWDAADVSSGIYFYKIKAE